METQHEPSTPSPRGASAGEGDPLMIGGFPAQTAGPAPLSRTPHASSRATPGTGERGRVQSEWTGPAAGEATAPRLTPARTTVEPSPVLQGGREEGPAGPTRRVSAPGSRRGSHQSRQEQAMAHVETRLEEFSKEIFKVLNKGIADLGKTLKNEIAEMASAKASEINSSDEVELLAIQAKGKGREEEGRRTREWVERSSDNVVRTPARSNPVVQPTTTMATPATLDRNIEAALDNIMSPQQPGESMAVYTQ